MNNNIPVEISEKENNTEFTLSLDLEYTTANTKMTDQEKFEFAFECIRLDVANLGDVVSEMGYDLTMLKTDGAFVGGRLELFGKLITAFMGALEGLQEIKGNE